MHVTSKVIILNQNFLKTDLCTDKFAVKLSNSKVIQYIHQSVEKQTLSENQRKCR